MSGEIYILYPIIFQKGTIPDEIVHRNLIHVSKLDKNKIKTLIKECEEELERPTKEWTKTYKMKSNEEEVRDYVKRFIEVLKTKIEL